MTNTNVTVLSLVLHVWTGRAVLKRADLPAELQAQLPPEALTSANTGSVKLCDPKFLKPVNAAANRAREYCQRQGPNLFGSGAIYVIDSNREPEVSMDLKDLRRNFDVEVADFLDKYAKYRDEWIASFPEWSHIVESYVPTPAQLARKFSMDFAFADFFPHENSTTDFLSALPRSLMEDCAEEIARLKKEICGIDRKRAPSERTFQGFKPLLERLRNSTFLHPQVAQLSKILTTIRTHACSSLDDAGMLGMISTVLDALSTVEGIDRLCAECKDSGFYDIWHVSGGAIPVEPEPTPQPQPQPTPQTQPQNLQEQAIANVFAAFM